MGEIETGASDARFGVVERLAAALDVDPAELFAVGLTPGSFRRGAHLDLSIRLAGLSDGEIVWIAGIVDAAFNPKDGHFGTCILTTSRDAASNSALATRCEDVRSQSPDITACGCSNWIVTITDSCRMARNVSAQMTFTVLV